MYDYNHWNDPKIGNKHVYAYGERYESLSACGFIHADNIEQAKTILYAHNNSWGDENILLPYSESECRAEIERRKIA